MASNDRFLTGLLVSLFLAGCGRMHHNDLYVEVDEANLVDGKKLAARYCQGCHSLPDPSVADAASWYNRILPGMGPRLGIFRRLNQDYPNKKADRNLPAGFYPSKPLVTDTEWQHIVDYYSATSPDSLVPERPLPEIRRSLTHFTASVPPGAFSARATSFLAFDSGDSSTILVADALSRRCYRYNNALQVTDSFAVEGSLVGLSRMDSSSWTACDIGVLNPNNGRFGKLKKLTEKHSRWTGLSVIADSLRRPVFISQADLDGDGRLDFVVCEFGNEVGALSWLRNSGDGHYSRQILSPEPGAIRTVITDYNHDGLPDIWCLFSQGDEGIVLFTNLGHGHFSRKQLLRFPPIYGSSYFELDDFNKDGFPDILYTCGDNADYSPVLKPYHGIYIFLNNGHNGFKQRYFFPQNGTYKAMARDFDGDGDLDIASIAFFPDLVHRPEESFVYLENQGNYEFAASTFPEATNGRWLTMDVGDINADGKPDILLGNFSIVPAMTKDHPDWSVQPPFVLLTNTYPWQGISPRIVAGKQAIPRRDFFRK